MENAGMNNDVAWDIHFGFPNPEYMQYISHTLLAGLEIQNIDPFVQDIPDDKINYAYVRRSHFDKRRLPKFSIIVSKNGGGKSTFARWRSWKFSENNLFIELPVNKLIALVAKREGYTYRTVEEDVFSGLMPELYIELRETLLNCGPFDDYGKLKALFVDARISVWRDLVPRTFTPNDQVNETISVLYKQYNVNRENALVLLLKVLRDQKSPVDTYYQKLENLAKELEQLQPASSQRLERGGQILSKGKGGLLTTDLLIEYIFNIYWERIFCDFYRQAVVNHLRKSQIWMQQLRWFYHYYRPAGHPHIPEDFELMAWLNCCPPGEIFNQSAISKSLLEDFVRFITEPATDRSGSPVRSPYTNIQIFIDGTDRIEYFSLLSLMRDLERLYDLSIDNLSVSLLLDKTLEDVVQDMDCVKKKYFAVCPLQPWDHRSLRRLLAMRLAAWRINEVFENEQEMADWNWAQQLLPDKDLHPVAKLHVIDRIVDAALCISEAHAMDAPVHALKLAQGFIAACAGCWPQYQHPLTMEAINTIIEIYRQSVLEERNDS